MLRSILLALDDTPGAAAARDLAFSLARRHGARVVGVLVLDRPHTLGSHEPVPVGGGAFAARRNAALAAAVEAEGEAVLAAALDAAQELDFTVVRREEAPEAALLSEGAAHDLLVIGRDCTLGREEADHGLSPTVEALVRDAARPLLVVPPGAVPAGPVLVAHEASPASQRTLQVFALLGLGAGSSVHLCAFADGAEAMGRYFRSHGLEVETTAGHGEVVDGMLTAARRFGASLLVLGAGEEGGLSRLVFGSETGRLLRAAPCPVFIHG